MRRVHRGDGRVLAALARGEASEPAALGRPRRSGAAGLLGLMPAYRGGERPRLQPQGGLHRPRQPAPRARPPPGVRRAVRRRDRAPDGDPERAARDGDPHRRRDARSRPGCWRARTPRTLAILGAGMQARAHLEAMRGARRSSGARSSRPTPSTPQRLAAAAARALAGGRRRGGAERAGGASRRRRRRHRDHRARRRCSSATGSRRARTSTRSARASPPRASSTSRRSPRRRSSSTRASRPPTRPATTSWRSREGAIGPEHVRAELGELADRRAPGPQRRRGADRLQVARARGRGPRRRRARGRAGRARRAPASRSSCDRARGDRGRARADRRRRGAHAARAAARRGRAGRDLLQARDAAAGQLVQDPRRRQRRAAAPTPRALRAAWSPRAPATWPRASPGSPACSACRRRSSSPRARPRTKLAAIERFGGTVVAALRRLVAVHRRGPRARAPRASSSTRSTTRR